MDELEALLERLLGHGVEFVIVGGYAAVAHGVTLVTQDLDICCRFSVENLMRLQAALVDLNPVHRQTTNRRSLALTPKGCRRLKNLYLQTDYGQVDCLGAIAGVGGFEDALEQSEELDIGIGICRILTLGSLIRAKEAINRPRDREAVVQLKAIAERRKSDE